MCINTAESTDESEVDKVTIINKKKHDPLHLANQKGILQAKPKQLWTWKLTRKEGDRTFEWHCKYSLLECNPENCFLGFSNKGTHRPLHLCSKGARLDLKADSRTWNCPCNAVFSHSQNSRVMVTQRLVIGFPKATRNRVRFLSQSSWVNYEQATKMKSVLQWILPRYWRCQEHGIFSEEDSDAVARQYRREDTWAGE